MEYMSAVIDIIEAKRDGFELSAGQIDNIIDGYSEGAIPDYQMSAFLMAVVCRGMSDEETIALTRAMLKTGETLDLAAVQGIKLDKHSTGGVGDKISIALVPIVAAAGIPIAKMSGRGLGTTGGTLDKLESITGFNVELSTAAIINQVKTVGACLCAQTSKIAPADKAIYALRDVTGTVESIPLIASSIMSKKLAGGADIIVLDVKVGKGAFMKHIEDARRLANLMRAIGEGFGKKVICELTDMDTPIGQSVGNLIEIKEAADLLRGRPVDRRLKDLVLTLSDTALKAAGANLRASELVESGAAWNKFSEIVTAQGGDISSIDLWDSVPPASVVTAQASGYIAKINADIIGRASVELGAGRQVKDSLVDKNAGIRIEAVVGTEVQYGSVLAKLYGSENKQIDKISEAVNRAFLIAENRRPARAAILETIPVDLP
jgi:pyrimidine-nucleoside phosphorylase